MTALSRKLAARGIHYIRQGASDGYWTQNGQIPAVSPIDQDDATFYASVQRNLDSALQTLTIAYDMMDHLKTERDQAQAQAAQDKQALIDLTMRYEQLSRECLLLQRDADELHQIKAREGRAKIRATNDMLRQKQDETLALLQEIKNDT